MATGSPSLEKSLQEFKDGMKTVLKVHVRQTISPKADAFWEHFQQVIKQAVDMVAQRVLDETKIEEATTMARSGATFTAIAAFSDKVADEALKEATSVMAEIGQLFTKAMSDASKEAISELVMEEVQKRIGGSHA